MNNSIDITYVRNIQRFNEIFFKVRWGRLFWHAAVLQNQCNEVGQNLQGEGPTSAFARDNLLICGKEYRHASHEIVLEISKRPACNCKGKCFGNVKVEERKNFKDGFYSLSHH
jgi:hypothetical protein